MGAVTQHDRGIEGDAGATDDGANPGVALDGVSVTFGGVTALDDVSIAVENGEFFTLVGPSGCGKTTTLRAIAGFETPAAGHVRIGGQRVDGVPPEERDVGIVFQNYALFPHMSVRENVAYGLRFRDPPGDATTEERVDELLSLVDMAGMGERTITLNGFSKAYAMTGWRLGYFAGPAELIEEAGKVHGHSVSCAVNFVQHAGVEALRNTDEAVAEMAAAFEQRRDMLIEELADRGVEVPAPEGAFYLMLPVAEDDQAWCETAIGEAHVATVPGSAFGTPGYARVSYANSTERLREALDRLDEHGLLDASA
ncbi:MAG: aspartate aminotransferase [Halobacteriales archaeon SW_9_67_24]|nr:MAG: aspartate aminotransferase [Halobacteriales archaeon SW_9_67_24]